MLLQNLFLLTAKEQSVIQEYHRFSEKPNGYHILLARACTVIYT